MAISRNLALGACGALGAAALYWGFGWNEPEITRPSNEREISKEVLKRVLPSSKLQPERAVPDKGPNGMPIEKVPGRRLKREGLPPRPGELAASDAETWDKRRIETGAAWAKASVDAVDRYAKEKNLSEEDSAALMKAIVGFTNDVEKIREDIRTGAVTPRDGRAAVVTARNKVAEAMKEQLGSEADVLRESLQSETTGGGW